MADVQRIILVDSAQIAARGPTLFGDAALTIHANGSVPPEAIGHPDVVVVSAERERIENLCPQLVASQCALVRAWHEDISEFTTRQQVLDAAGGIKPYSPVVDLKETLPVAAAAEKSAGPTSGSGQTSTFVDSTDSPPQAEPPPSAPLDTMAEPAGGEPPEWHNEIPEGAEVASVTPFRKRKRGSLHLIEGNTARAPDPEHEAMPASLSEDHLAEHFVETHGTRWRFVPEWNMWLQWLGDGWHRDKRNEVSDVLKGVTRDALQWRDGHALTPDGKRKLNSKRTAWNARDVAAVDRRISILADELDADPFLMGVPGGVVDLKNGKLLDAEPEQYITRRCAVAPEKGEHPLFDRVLARACAGHDGMREYLLRWFGYMLTGDVREEAFMFLYGPGGSGKSTLIKCVTEIMGEYAVSISMDAFTESKHPRHSQEIAKLAGMRLVYASETDEGRRWNEALIKALTGRDKITAHKMRMDDFDFDPTFKLMLFGNSIPHLKSVGEEIRRRIHLVEYAGSLTENERDSTLKDRLKAEYPAILYTLIQGCVDWLDCRGLGKPESVTASVDEYLASEDNLAIFLADCTERDPQAKELSGSIYRRYKNWAMAAGEYVGSQKKLVSSLKQRGFGAHKSGDRFITGLRLKAAEPGDDRPHWHQQD